MRNAKEEFLSDSEMREIENVMSARYSLNTTIDIVFYTGRHLDEIREGRRREETRRCWDNHHMRLGTTVGQGYL